MKKEGHPGSYFDGGFWQSLGYDLFVLLLSVVTLGLAYPYAYCKRLRWQFSHVHISGSQLVFEGKAMEIFSRWLVWLLLTVVTLGIYALFIPTRFMQWLVSRTHFEGEKDRSSEFSGFVMTYILYFVLGTIASVISLGLFASMQKCLMCKWKWNYSEISGHDVSFLGDWKDLFLKRLKWFLLTLITIGIYGFYSIYLEKVWIYSQLESKGLLIQNNLREEPLLEDKSIGI